jgi:CYTH domain-containing protein
MKIEIERRFLLKSLPDAKPIEIIKIKQWYLKIDGVWERIRIEHSNINGKKIIHTVKTKISVMSNMEEEKLISKKEFDKFIKLSKSDKSSKFISKKRFIYSDGKHKWEVDFFDQKCHIIIAEVELPKEDYLLNLPIFIQKKLLMEVTGFKQFSSRNLSNKI